MQYMYVCHMYLYLYISYIYMYDTCYMHIQSFSDSSQFVVDEIILKSRVEVALKECQILLTYMHFCRQNHVISSLSW